MTVKIETATGNFEYDISPGQHLLLLNVGIFMMRVQNFETLLGATLCSLDKSAKELTLDNIDSVMEKFNKQTLGQLTTLMKSIVQGKPLHDQLITVRNHRNFIAHHGLRSFSYLDDAQAVAESLKIDAALDLIQEVQDFLIQELSAQNVTDISEVSMQINDDGTVTFL